MLTVIPFSTWKSPFRMQLCNRCDRDERSSTGDPVKVSSDIVSH